MVPSSFGNVNSSSPYPVAIEPTFAWLACRTWKPVRRRAVQLLPNVLPHWPPPHWPPLPFVLAGPPVWIERNDPVPRRLGPLAVVLPRPIFVRFRSGSLRFAWLAPFLGGAPFFRTPMLGAVAPTRTRLGPALGPAGEGRPAAGRTVRCPWVQTVPASAGASRLVSHRNFQLPVPSAQYRPRLAAAADGVGPASVAAAASAAAGPRRWDSGLPPGLD